MTFEARSFVYRPCVQVATICARIGFCVPERTDKAPTTSQTQLQFGFMVVPKKDIGAFVYRVIHVWVPRKGVLRLHEDCARVSFVTKLVFCVVLM